MRPHVTLCSLIVLLGASRVLADSCVGGSSVAAANQHYKVDGQGDRDSRKWSYVLTDLRTGEKRTGPLPKIDWHAHLYFFLSQDSRRFAVLDASAGHHRANRFMIHTADGELLVSLGVDDILAKEEQTEVQHSVSHMSWLKYDRELRSYGTYVSVENAVSLTTMAGREVTISLVDGKVIEASFRPRQFKGKSIQTQTFEKARIDVGMTKQEVLAQISLSRTQYEPLKSGNDPQLYVQQPPDETIESDHWFLTCPSRNSHLLGGGSGIMLRLTFTKGRVSAIEQLPWPGA